MRKVPTLSIIIPFYNTAAYLERCLKSILTQSLRDIEVICINDGSTDGSMKIMRRYITKEKRLHVYSFEKNYGTVIATKLGLLNAKGKYVMFVDSDDVLLPDACENLVRRIEELGVDILQYAINVNVPDGIDISGFLKRLQYKPMSSEGANLLSDCFVLRRFPHNLVNKIYRREVCRAAAEKMPDLHIKQFADLYMMFFILYYAKTFRSVPDGPYYTYYFGIGISTCALDEKLFADVCSSSVILSAIEGFLKWENTLEQNRFLLESIGIVLKSDVINKLLTLPEITKETVDIAVKSWGSGVLYDFIKATGLLDVKCESRYNLVPTLVKLILKRNAPPPITAGETAASGEARNAAQPVPESQPAK